MRVDPMERSFTTGLLFVLRSNNGSHSDRSIEERTSTRREICRPVNCISWIQAVNTSKDACFPRSTMHLCREGTTDVTRTVHLGQPSDFEKVSADFLTALRESHLSLVRSGMFHPRPQRISLVIVLSVPSEHHWRSVGLVCSPCSLGCWTGLPAWNGTRRWLLSQCS